MFYIVQFLCLINKKNKITLKWGSYKHIVMIATNESKHMDDHGVMRLHHVAHSTSLHIDRCNSQPVIDRVLSSV